MMPRPHRSCFAGDSSELRDSPATRSSPLPCGAAGILYFDQLEVSAAIKFSRSAKIASGRPSIFLVWGREEVSAKFLDYAGVDEAIARLISQTTSSPLLSDGSSRL